MHLPHYFLFLSYLLYFPPDDASLSKPSYSMVDSKGIPLDQKLVQLLNKKNGLFIEVGANNGVEQSNTKLLEEQHGWTGILVEPSPCLYDALCRNRPNSKCFSCALGPFELNNTYIWGDFDGHPMSSVNGKRIRRRAKQKVLMRSLQAILDQEGVTHVDFFSLDVEGYELPVLHGIDFNKVVFDYMLVEIMNKDFKNTANFLSSMGYELIENFSTYNPQDNPDWDGNHNDYLFIRRSLCQK